MTRQRFLIAAGGLVVAWLVITVVLAAPQDGFDLGWHVIPGGGGRSASHDYAVDGSAGQPAAGALSSADYRLGAGFWPGIGAESPTPTPTGSPSPTPTPTVTPTGPPPLVVNATGDTDDGTCDATHCSLREALNAAQLHAGPDTITFNIPGSDAGCDADGVCTIQPAWLLPALTDGGTTIDGYTQPGASAGGDPVLRIVIDGYDNGSFSGLAVRSANNLIRGLVIQRFTPFTGIDISGTGARDNQVEGNFIGTDVTGTLPRGNCTPPTSCGAIWIQDGAQGNTIGPGNLIAFNGRGVWVLDSDTQRNTITRNRIHSNAGQGIWLFNGGNGELAPPVITTASATQVSGTACANCTVEVFSDSEGEGAIYEGTTTADASGNWTLTKPGGLTGPYVTATATDGDGNTSEFSAPVSLPDVTPTATVSPSPTPTPTPTGTAAPACQELLINGDFETGSLVPWGSWGVVGLGSGHTGAHGVSLGGTDNAGGELLQVVAIPSGATSVDLAFWWLVESASEQPGDFLEVVIQYGDEQVDLLLTLRAEEPLAEWQQEALDLGAYAGLEVAVTFLLHTDEESPSTFRVDDVSLEACGAAPPTPTSTPTATATPGVTEARVYLPVLMKSYSGS